MKPFFTAFTRFKIVAVLIFLNGASTAKGAVKSIVMHGQGSKIAAFKCHRCFPFVK